MTRREAEAAKRRAAAVAICARVPRHEAHDMLDMLGLLDLAPPRRQGTPWFDTGFDGGRRVMQQRER